MRAEHLETGSKGTRANCVATNFTKVQSACASRVFCLVASIDQLMFYLSADLDVLYCLYFSFRAPEVAQNDIFSVFTDKTILLIYSIQYIAFKCIKGNTVVCVLCTFSVYVERSVFWICTGLLKEFMVVVVFGFYNTILNSLGFQSTLQLWNVCIVNALLQ